MSGFLTHIGVTGICPHGAPISVVSSNSRVMLNGQPAATLSDTYTVAGCAFTIPTGKPQPCVAVQWLVPAARVKINGQPAILQTSTGICKSAEQIPQGPPTMIATQLRVKGT